MRGYLLSGLGGQNEQPASPSRQECLQRQVPFCCKALHLQAESQNHSSASRPQLCGTEPPWLGSLWATHLHALHAAGGVSTPVMVWTAPKKCLCLPAVGEGIVATVGGDEFYCIFSYLWSLLEAYITLFAPSAIHIPPVQWQIHQGRAPDTCLYW